MPGIVTRRKRRPRREIPVQLLNWKGMFTTFADAPVLPGMAHYLQNCSPINPVLGGPVESRAGCDVLGATAAAGNFLAGAQVLAMFTFTRPQVSPPTVTLGRVVHDAAAGGAHIDTFSWATNTWTTVVSAANLNSKSIALGALTEIHWCEFNGEIVFNPSDGAGRPFTWDGSGGAGGLTVLTNAPIAYGIPVVYFAKLFFIEYVDRIAIDWSEEAQPNVGYGSGGYNNVWRLIQTDSQDLVALCATNDALFFFRRASIGKILGSVTPTFQTTGVQDGVSESVGCGDPRSVTRAGQEIWFRDPNSRFYYIPQGGAPVDVTPLQLTSSTSLGIEPFGFGQEGWEPPLPVRTTAGGINSTAIAFTQPYNSGAGSGRARVWFTLEGSPTDSSTEGRSVLVFDVETHLAQGYYTFPTRIRRLCVWRTLAGGEVAVWSGGNDGSNNANGAFTWGTLGTTGDKSWSGAAFTVIPLFTFLIGPAELATPDQETFFTRVDAVVYGAGLPTQVQFDLFYVSSEYPTASVTPAQQSQQVTFPSTGSEQHIAWGILTRGRWFHPALNWSAFDATLVGVKRLQTTAIPGPNPPLLA